MGIFREKKEKSRKSKIIYYLTCGREILRMWLSSVSDAREFLTEAEIC